MGSPIFRLVLFLTLVFPVIIVMATNSGTFYDKLEIKADASKTDIKKAYRRLALKYHPDKNPDPSAAERFREVSEAYEVLSDEDQKREYDRELRSGGGRASTSWHQDRTHGYRPRDPFAQFNDLFQNDPFFREAAAGLDDLFAKTFQEGASARTTKAGRSAAANGDNSQQSWGAWLGGLIVDKLGINVEITTSTTTNGKRSTSSYSRQRGGGGSRSYQARRTKTVIENGQRVTIQSLERDGNKIEERYVGTKLVGRTINGVPQEMGRIDL